MATRRASDRDPELDKTPEPPTDPKVSVLEGGHPNEYVRVRHPKTGDHFTTTRALAHRMGAALIPNHAAVDDNGIPLPRKPKES